MQFTVLLDESGVQKEKHGVANKAAKLIFACGNNHKSTVDLGYILTLPPAKLREKKKNCKATFKTNELRFRVSA